MHTDTPAVLAYLPAVQLVHDVPAATWPTAHPDVEIVHELAPAGEDLLALHMRQAVEAREEAYVPLWHVTHTDDPTWLA